MRAPAALREAAVELLLRRRVRRDAQELRLTLSLSASAGSSAHSGEVPRAPPPSMGDAGGRRRPIDQASFS